jgi:hypothetical protein
MSEQITNDDSELLTWLLRYIHAHGTNGLSDIPWTVTESNGEDSDIELNRAAIRAAMKGTMPPLHQSMSEELDDAQSKLHSAEKLVDELVKALINLRGECAVEITKGCWWPKDYPDMNRSTLEVAQSAIQSR